MNQHTGPMVVPSASNTPQSSVVRPGERTESLPGTAFSAALKQEMRSDGMARSPASAAGERPPSTPHGTSSGSTVAADSGKKLPEGGKSRPQEAASARHAASPADAESDSAGASAVAPPARSPTLDPELPAARLSEEASVESATGQAATDAEATSVSLEPLLDGENDPDHDETRPTASTDPLFEFFTRSLDPQAIAVPGVSASSLSAVTDAQDVAAATASVAEAEVGLDAPGNALTTMAVATGSPAADAALSKGQPTLIDESLDETLRLASFEAGAEAGSDDTTDSSADRGLAGDSAAPGGALPAGTSRASEGNSLFADLLPEFIRPAAGGVASGAGGLGPAVTAGMLSAVVGSEEWFDQLGTGLRWQVGEGVSEARLRLNPAELGTLDVQVRVTERGAEVHFLAPNAQAREALEQGMQRLRESLDAQGLQLADASVSDGRAGSDPRGQQGSPLPAWAASGWTAQEEAPSGDTSIGALLQGRGLIDLYA